MEPITPPADIAIIGAGIVGSALAYYLSVNNQKDRKVVLVDRSFSPLKGSTGHAPGFVGQYNESAVLTRLAIDSVNEYNKIPGGFETIGGIEVATSTDGIERLKSRHAKARNAGLSAELLSSQEAIQLAPDLVDGSALAGLHFASDGAANATRITSFYQDEARERGVTLVAADVKEIQQVDGRVTGIQTTAGFIQAKKVIIATGVWATQLCDFGVPIPVVPVAHPYMYSQHHEPKERKSPWVRWPEHHVYARDHGPFYGLGSYNHEPFYQEPNDTAIGDWKTQFDSTLADARGFIPSKTALVPREVFNGIFSMTPDNMPLVGGVSSVEGLYMAVAVWVTQAAGAAKFLVNMLDGGVVDEVFREQLDPMRFQGREMEDLKQQSLDGYNNIYKTVGTKAE